MYLRWVPCSFLPVVSYFIATSGVRLFPRAPLVFFLSCFNKTTHSQNKTNSGPRARPGRVPATTNLIRCQRYGTLR